MRIFLFRVSTPSVPREWPQRHFEKLSDKYIYMSCTLAAGFSSVRHTFWNVRFELNEQTSCMKRIFDIE